MRLYFSGTAGRLMGNFIGKRAFSSDVLLTGKKDLYEGITIKSKEYKDIKRRQARTILQQSLDTWIRTGVNGVWFEVDAKDVWWIPILLDNGFTFHHTMPDYVMLTKWLLSTSDSMPKYPFTFIGAGGLVVNSRGEVLLMKERRGPFLGWKFPGGASDYGELIHETAIREVREETGVDTEFVTLLAFRMTTNFRYKIASNIYFVCVLKPVNENAEVKPCPREAAACKWMPRSELDTLPESDFRWYYREVLMKYDAWIASKRRGCYYTDLVRTGGATTEATSMQMAIRQDVKAPASGREDGSSTDSKNNESDKINVGSPTDPNMVTGFYFFE